MLFPMDFTLQACLVQRNFFSSIELIWLVGFGSIGIFPMVYFACNSIGIFPLGPTSWKISFVL
jgi:hypothetical protein